MLANKGVRLKNLHCNPRMMHLSVQGRKTISLLPNLKQAFFSFLPVDFQVEFLLIRTVILNSCLKKTRAAKVTRYNREVIFFEKLRFPNVFRPHENAFSSGLRSVFEKLRFRDGLVWTVGKAAFSNSSSVVCTRHCSPGRKLNELILVPWMIPLRSDFYIVYSNK